MRKIVPSMPLPLQRYMLIQILLLFACLAVAVVVMIYFSVTMMIPFLVGAAIFAANAVRLHYIAATGTYLALKGTVLKVDYTLLRRRAQSLIMETEGKALRVNLRNRHLAVQSGDRILIYIKDTTPLTNWRGIHQLHSYLTMVKETAYRETISFQ